MLEQKEITIGGSNYVLQQFPTTSGLEIGIALVKIIAGAAEGIGDVPPGGGILDVEFNPGRMAAGVMKQFDVTGTPQLVRRMVRESVITPVYSDDWYESEFSGDYDRLGTMIEKIVAHNRYSDLVKKRLPEIMGLISSDTSTEGQDSTRSTSDPSPTASPRSPRSKKSSRSGTS